MKGEEFLNFAEATLSGGLPVHHRVAIGRSYYGAFNVAAELLRAAGCQIPQNAGAHGVICRLLQEVKCDLTVYAAGSWINSARGIRNKADYELLDTKVEGRNIALRFVLSARNHVTALRSAFAGPLATKIVEEVLAQQAREKSTYRPPG